MPQAAGVWGSMEFQVDSMQMEIFLVRQKHHSQGMSSHCSSCAIWGPPWSHNHVQVLCDNAAVISMVNSKTSKCKDIMHLLRCMHFFLAYYYELTIKAVHIPGVLNTSADVISRNHPQVLLYVLPQLSHRQTLYHFHYGTS